MAGRLHRAPRRDVHIAFSCHGQKGHERGFVYALFVCSVYVYILCVYIHVSQQRYIYRISACSDFYWDCYLGLGRPHGV